MRKKYINAKICICFVWLVNLSSLIGQETLENEQIPTKLLFKQNERHGFTISPDGKYFTEIVSTKLGDDIVVVDIDAYTVYRKLKIPFREVQDVYWLTSDRILYETYGEIYAIDIDGGDKTIIVDKWANEEYKNINNYYAKLKYSKFAGFVRDNENEILIQTFGKKGYVSLKRVNIYTGETKMVIDGKKYRMHDWLFDIDGEPRMGIQVGEEVINYFVFNKTLDEWIPCEVVLNGKRVPFQINPNVRLNNDIGFEGFGYDKNIIYLSSAVGSDRAKLITYDIELNRELETLIEDQICDIQDPLDDRLKLFFDPKTRKLAGVRYEGITPQFTWLSESFKNPHDELNAAYPGFIHDVIDFDRNQKKFVIYQWSDTNAGNIGIYDSESKEYAVMFHMNEDLNNYELSHTKSIVVETRDGYKIPCYINLPNHKDNTENIPLVVIPHGGPWARDYWDYDPIVQFFTQRGYATLKINFRGSTGFGKTHVLSGIQNIDKVMINDIVDATNFVKNNYAIASKKVFLYGHSYGGYATYMGLLKYPGVYMQV